MCELVIRDAVASDLPELVALLADDVLGVTREDPSLPLDPAYLVAFEALDTDPRHRLLVAALDERLVGTLTVSILPVLTHRGTWRAQIEAVRVAGDVRGQRIGTRLVAAGLDVARAAGCGLVQLTTTAVRADAQRFWAAQGFEPTHVGMKLRLGPQA